MYIYSIYVKRCVYIERYLSIYIYICGHTGPYWAMSAYMCPIMPDCTIWAYMCPYHATW